VILSAGLSPAWQQILVFDHFRPGEVNRAREAVWCASGKVINAGVGLHSLGGPSLTLSPAGGGPLVQMDRELAALGVPRRWIETESATRVCTTILDRSTGTMTELVENGRPMRPQELDAYRAAYDESAARAEVAVVIGSLPAGVPMTLYRELLERTPCPVVLDFRGEGLLSVLHLKPLVVKPNREELAQTTGRPLRDDAELLSAMRELNRRGAGWVVVTQGPGPVWITSVDRAVRIDPPPMAEVVNPIGSGDAMAAGIAWSIRAGRDMVDAVRFGVAAACYNVGQLLPCRLDRAAVERLMERVRAEG
jgi:1-phosphofructokinase family hexose kinase